MNAQERKIWMPSPVPRMDAVGRVDIDGALASLFPVTSAPVDDSIEGVFAYQRPDATGRYALRRFVSCGAVAQLGERCIRIAEVRGSSPLSSITIFSSLFFR